MTNLGVDYFSNRRAWMTSKLFTRWLHQINNKVIKQGREILLFIDNCPSYAAVDLSNLKIQMLPLNTTARLQPCDAGIKQAVKLKRRRIFLRQNLFRTDSDETTTATKISKSVSLLNAIIWLRVAWLRVKSGTVNKCFRNCGFEFDFFAFIDQVTDESDNPCPTDFTLVLEDITMNEYASRNNDVPTSDLEFAFERDNEDSDGTAGAKTDDDAAESGLQYCFIIIG